MEKRIFRPPARSAIRSISLSPVPWETIQTTGLFLLCIALPGMRAVKHAGLILVLIGSLGRITTKRRLIGMPDTFEWFLVAGVSVSLMSGLLNLHSTEGLHGAKDIFRYAFLAWVMYRYPLSCRKGRILAYCLACGTFTALLWGGYDYAAGLTPAIQLHGTDAVTQSSIYLAIMAMLFLGKVTDTSSSFSKTDRFFFSACFLVAVGFLWVMGSRGGLLGMVVALTVLAPLFFRRRKDVVLLSGGMMIGAACFTLCLAACFPETVLSRRISHIAATTIDFKTFSVDLDFSDELRRECWKIAFIEATEGDNKWFGIGPGNFRTIDIDTPGYKKRLSYVYTYGFTPHHAHNIYLNTWVEQGRVGLIVMVMFHLFLVRCLYIVRPGRDGVRWEWVAAVGALVISVVAGQFHKGWAAEVAWLSMMLIGLGLSPFQQTQSSR